MAIDRRALLSALERLAPLSLAESWDRVGLQVEGGRERRIKRVFLTIDLVRATLEEALAERAEAVVAYHPLIFEPIRALVRDNGRAEIALRAAEEGLLVYSPHTALDAVAGGLNDWLAEGLGEGRRGVLSPQLERPDSESHKLVVYVPESHVEPLRGVLAKAGAGRIGNYSECSFATPGRGTFRGGPGTAPVAGVAGRFETVDEVRLEMVVGRSRLAEVLEALRSAHPYEEPAYDLYEQSPRPSTTVGQGRLVELERDQTLGILIGRLKKHLGLKRLRRAVAVRHEEGARIRRIGVCAGAGGSQLARCDVDLFVTGEMRHHDIVAARERGVSVILAEHSNTERGYLPILGERLKAALDHRVDVLVSARDRDPIEVV